MLVRASDEGGASWQEHAVSTRQGPTVPMEDTPLVTKDLLLGTSQYTPLGTKPLEGKPYQRPPEDPVPRHSYIEHEGFNCDSGGRGQNSEFSLQNE